MGYKSTRHRRVEVEAIIESTSEEGYMIKSDEDAEATLIPSSSVKIIERYETHALLGMSENWAVQAQLI